MIFFARLPHPIKSKFTLWMVPIGFSMVFFLKFTNAADAFVLSIPEDVAALSGGANSLTRGSAIRIHRLMPIGGLVE